MMEDSSVPEACFSGHVPNVNNNCSKSKAAALFLRQDSAGSTTSDEEYMYVSMACGDCGDLFPTCKELLLHRLAIHADRRPHQCPACMAAFWQPELLRQHKRTHTVDTPHACAYCNLRFTLRSHVIAHTRALHLPKKEQLSQEHRCSECADRVFQSASKLHNHMRCHSEERLACKDCEKTFRYPHNLGRHSRKHHLSEV